MAYKNPEYKIPKGTSGNPAGSTQKVRIIKSPLRKTADSLREVEEDALKSIKAAVKGDKIDKDQLDTSKWVISMIQTLDKSASAEEIASAKVRLDAKKAQENGAGVEDMHTAEVVPMSSRLKLTYDADEEVDE